MKIFKVMFLAVILAITFLTSAQESFAITKPLFSYKQKKLKQQAKFKKELSEHLELLHQIAEARMNSIIDTQLDQNVIYKEHHKEFNSQLNKILRLIKENEKSFFLPKRYFQLQYSIKRLQERPAAIGKVIEFYKSYNDPLIRRFCQTLDLCNQTLHKVDLILLEETLDVLAKASKSRLEVLKKSDGNIEKNRAFRNETKTYTTNLDKVAYLLSGHEKYDHLKEFIKDLKKNPTQASLILVWLKAYPEDSVNAKFAEMLKSSAEVQKLLLDKRIEDYTLLGS